MKVDLPSTSQTVLLLYCERSGVAERRLDMAAVFLLWLLMTVVFKMLWFLCATKLFCRVLSLPLKLKISQTCSLVYTVNTRKITTLLLQQIRYTSSVKRYVPKGTKLLLPVLSPAVLFWQSVHSLCCPWPSFPMPRPQKPCMDRPQGHR